MDYLALYSTNCKKCKHLDQEETKAYDKCHYSKGNNDCPAKEVQIAVVGQTLRAATELKKARAKGDLNREAQILEAVAKKSPAFQHKFKELVG